MSVCPLSHCHSPLKRDTSHQLSLDEHMNKDTALCLCVKGKYGSLIIIVLMCWALSSDVAHKVRLDIVPQVLSPCQVLQACHLLRGLSGTNRWVDDPLERQETDIISSPLRGSHYQRPPSGASCCFIYYLTSTLACAAQRSGCVSHQLWQTYQFQH